MARLFISHSSKDGVAAVAFKQWLGTNGWPEEDVFLDIEDIGGGERWKDALRKAHARCEAVVLLASPDALASPECLTEVRKAEDFGKEIIVVLMRDLTIDDRRLESYRERQIVDLSAPPQAHREIVQFRGTRQEVRFNNEALAKVRDYLVRRGITPDNFPWPPHERPDAEPFPGLSAFTEDEAAIFFGRDADILTGLDEFRLLRNKGTPRFLAIQAASGAGKSSFLRAGLWPRLARDPDFAPLAILRPAQGILTGPEGLGQKLAPRLSRPGAPINPGDVYTRLMDDDAGKASAEFVRFMMMAAEQAHDQRRIGNPNALPPALVLAIDQAEELLTPENTAESQRLLLLVANLMRELPEGVEPFALLTVRAESATRLYQAIAEQKLEVPKAFPLLALPRTSYRDVIVKPIDVVARHGKRIAIEPALTERLVADTIGADALPLLAFTLHQLYTGFSAGNEITLEDYRALGGVAGSIKGAIRAALASPNSAPVIPAAADEQLAILRATFIPWLARIDPASGEAMRRTAKIDEFNGGARAMVERLIEKRLLVADRRGDADVVEVAHESLLRQWPPLVTWLKAAADDLRIADAVENAASEWVRNGRRPAWLDHRGERLSAAEKVSKREDYRGRFDADMLAYLKASRARDNAQRRIKRAAIWASAAVLLLAVFGFYEWRDSARARQESEASLFIAQSGAYLSNRNTAAAVTRARQAFTVLPSVASRSALLQATMEIPPHLAVTIRFGSDGGQALAWAANDDLDVATATHLRAIDTSKPSETSGEVVLPVIKRSHEEGNRSMVRALAQISDGRMIALFDEGSVGIYRRGGAMQLQRVQQRISVDFGPQPITVSHSGSLIALATTDETILVYHCGWGAASASTRACSSAPLGDVRGQTVAISPDEQRIAVGDQAGKVTLYDLSGKALGPPVSLDGAINTLAWTALPEQLAAGTTTGEIAVLAAGDSMKAVARHKFGDQPITALAWNPHASTLAFVCDGTAICLWHPPTPDSDHPFKPAVRLEGSRAPITRLSFAPAGAQLASLATDGSVRVWNVAQDTDATFALYGDVATKFSTVGISPDRRWVAAGSTDGIIQLWDAKTGATSRSITIDGRPEIRDLAWNHSGVVAALDDRDAVHIISTAGNDPSTNVALNGGSGYRLVSVQTHAGYHLVWADGDRVLALPTGEQGVVLMDPNTPEAKPRRLGRGKSEDQAWGATSIPGTRLLAVSYVGGDLRLWDLAAPDAVPTPFTPPQPRDMTGVGSLSVSPDKRLLATSSGNGSVPIYDIAERAPWRVLKTESPAISTVAFSPDGQRLAALGSDKRLYVWTLGKNTAELFLAVNVVLHRAIVSDTSRASDKAGWLDWISDDQIAIATDIAAISVVCIDPAKWLRRIDALALSPAAPLD